MVNWKAVAYAIVASFVIGLISGLGLPFTNATLPVIGFGLSGLIAGAVAGYVNHGGMGSDAIHGLLGTTIGGLILGVILTVIGTFAGGVAGLGAGLMFIMVILASGIPGAVGGALGGLLTGKEDTVSRPAA